MQSTRLFGRACARLSLHMLITAIVLTTAPGGSWSRSTPSAGVGPSVKEVVEFTKLVPQGISALAENKINLSPNRRRAFVVTRKASVERGSNAYEILLLDLDPQSLERSKAPAPKRLLKFEGTFDNNYAIPLVQNARWLDDDMLAFRARLTEGPFQVYILDVNTGKLSQRTFENDNVVSFGIAADLSRVVYAIQVPNPPMAPGQRSLVVDNSSFFSANFGQNYLPSQRHQFQYAVIDAGSVGLGRRLGSVFPGIAAPYMPNISVAPDGRWALIPRYEESRHLEWAAKYPLMGDTAQKAGPALRLDPKGYFVRPRQWLARRNIAYRLDDATERPVLDAPDDATPGDPTRVDTAWLEGGKSVIVAGTHVPAPPPGSVSPVSTASHVIEYWPDSGRYVLIAALDRRLEFLRAPADGKGFTLHLEGGRRLNFVRDQSGRWSSADASDSVKFGDDQDGHQAAGGWQLRNEQALNIPPDILAVGPRGDRVRLTALNPEFAPSTWGNMRAYSWRDVNGKRYVGGLMVPSNYDPSRRYPVVLQTYGFDPKHFYLDGANMHDGWTSGFAGRAFLRQDILVLALPYMLREPDEPRSLPIRHDRAAAMAQSAIDALVSEGIADPERVGIMGWSVWGEHVQNMLTFYDLPVRAASILDGDSNSLFALVVTTGHSDYVYRRFEATNAGMPYGNGLANWVARDPSLHTDCIRAAVRIENYGPSSKIHWDTYGLLRRQLKPAEKVEFPGGAHSLAHPGDRMISLQGNVDWYAFWLAGRERSEVLLASETPDSLRRQYSRWRQMAELKQLDDAKPRCSATRPIAATRQH